VDPSADMSQSKGVFRSTLGGLLENRKIGLSIFWAPPPPKTKRFLGAIFQGVLGDAVNDTDTNPFSDCGTENIFKVGMRTRMVLCQYMPSNVKVIHLNLTCCEIVF
jgi:hypothetical protein